MVGTGEDRMDEETKKEKGQAEKEKAPEKPLDKMTATELREVAMGMEEITGAHAMKKDDLLKAIKEARGIQDEEPPKKAKKAVRVEASVEVLKQKLVALKEEKKAAREAKDKKKVEVYRRRINRLKKRTRKAVQA
jgi:hypothetical protein